MEAERDPTDGEPTLGSGLTPAQLWFYYLRYPYLLAKLVTFALVVGVIYWVFLSIEEVLFPVLLSLLIAYLLDPVVDWFEARGWGRVRAIGVVIAVGGGGVALFLLFLYPTIAGAITKVVEGAPTLFETFQDKAIPWIEETTGTALPATLSQAAEEYGSALRNQVPRILQGVTSGAADVWSRTGALVASLLNLVMIPIFTFYFLRDFDKMRLGLVDYIPAGNRPWILERIRRMDQVVGAWFRGQCEVASILAVLYATGLGIVFAISGIGVTAGIAIGLLAGFLNVIPYFGFLIGFVLSILMVLLEWSGIGPLIGVLAVFAIVQALEGYVITPRIVGEKVGLSPVVVIIALLIGGEVLGLLGVLLALPVAGIVRVLLPDLVAQYRASPFFTGALAQRRAEILGMAPPAAPKAEPSE